MDIQSILSSPAIQQAGIALASWGIAQGAKYLKMNPRYAPIVAALSGIATNVYTGAAGDSFPAQAVLGALLGLAASGGHEIVQKAQGK